MNKNVELSQRLCIFFTRQLAILHFLHLCRFPDLHHLISDLPDDLKRIIITKYPNQRTRRIPLLLSQARSCAPDVMIQRSLQNNSLAHPVNFACQPQRAKSRKMSKKSCLALPHRAAQNSSFVKSKPLLEKRLSGKLIPSQFPFRRGAFPPSRRPQTFFPNRGHRGNDPHSALRGRFVLRSQVGLDCSAPCAPP